MTGPTRARTGALGRIKGTPFADFMTWYEARYGREPVWAALSAASAKYGVEFDRARPGFGIVVSYWYDAEIVHAALDELAQRHTGSELDALTREAANAIMSKTLRGVYRAVFSLAVTPARYVQHVDKAWRLHYDNGRPIIIARENREHRISYKDWKSHHPVICRLNMATAVPIYGAMGCTNIAFERRACVSDGAEQCETVITWG